MLSGARNFQLFLLYFPKYTTKPPSPNGEGGLCIRKESFTHEVELCVVAVDYRGKLTSLNVFSF